MASTPPIVTWWLADESAVTSLWDAGVVEAGSESTPQEFHVWNNRGGATEVADMINVTMTVRDSSGGTDDKAVAGQEQAIVSAMFFDQSKNAGAGEWGSFDTTSGVWVANQYTDLDYRYARKLQAVGTTSAGAPAQTISGAANNAAISTAGNNYASVQLKVYAKPDAAAGEVWWSTRVSYQYT